jgi:hypothetical protein
MNETSQFKILRMVVLLLISFAISGSKGNSQSLGMGTISGKVINVKGEPISDARVSAQRVGVIAMQWPSTETNGDGEFTLNDLAPGTYRLHAGKEDDGYAPTYSVFRSDDIAFAPHVSVTENQAVLNIVIQLGSKGGWLTGRVVSALTSQAITDAQITVRRVDDPTKFFSTGLNNKTKRGGSFKILVPTAPFTVEVTALGYDSWRYMEIGSARGADSITMAPEETRRLTIRMRPKE